MSYQVQFIVVIIILVVVIAWTIYKLLRKKNDKFSGCSSCALSETCKKNKENCR